MPQPKPRAHVGAPLSFELPPDSRVPPIPLSEFLRRPRSAKDVGPGHDYLMVHAVSNDNV